MGASSSKAKDDAASERARATGKAQDANNSSGQQCRKTSTMLRKLTCFRSPSASTSSQELSQGKERNCTCTSENERATSPTTSVDQKHHDDDDDENDENDENEEEEEDDDDKNTWSEPFSQNYERQCLQKAGIYIARQIGSGALPDTGKHLCQKLSGLRYAIPEKPLYQGDNFFRVLETVRTDNPTRLFRDLTPLIVPTPEHLFWTGLSSVDYLREKLFTRWDQVVPIADGPTIHPDVAVGLQSHAFSNYELKQLDDYHCVVTPARFCEDLYFPFFTCDLSHGLRNSERKNARSAATAIHAILKLYAAGNCNLESLSHEVLFFSISHDAAFVEIFAHYPVIKNRKAVKIHCHMVRSFDLNYEDGTNRWTSYHYVRALYEHFSKIHLQRIQEAIIRLPNKGAQNKGSAASLSSADTAVDCEGHTRWRYLEAVLASIPRNLSTDNSSKSADNSNHHCKNCWNCWNCSHCHNCSNCRNCRNSKNLSNCSNCHDSKNLSNCSSCSNSKNLSNCFNCHNCSNLSNCSNRTDCHG